VRGLFHHPRTKDILDPEDIFSEFGFSNPREAYPNSSLVERQNASAPAQRASLPLICFRSTVSSTCKVRGLAITILPSTVVK
jgi:hypothetical protein